MTTAVWQCEPRSHKRNKAGTPLPGRPPSIAVPHRPASLALCPCGHSASFRRRASSFVRGVCLESAALLLAAALGGRTRCVRLAVRRACACCCPVAAAIAVAARALRLSCCQACLRCAVRARLPRAHARWVQPEAPRKQGKPGESRRLRRQSTLVSSNISA